MVFIFMLACGLGLQDPDSQDIEKLKKEVETLKRELAELKSKKPGQDVEELEDRIEKRLKDIEKRLESVNRTAAGTAFNPKITAFLNGAGRADNRRVFTDPLDPDSDKIDDNLFFRTAELDFRASIDPYADGVLILAIEGEPDGGFEIEVEEGFGVLKRLPVLEAAPWGMKLKMGKFRTPFGVSNRLHLHDMPHITRPLVVSRFLGSENGEFFEVGHSPPGVELELLPPLPLGGAVLTLYADMVQAGHVALTDGNNGTQPAPLAHIDVFVPIHPEHTFNLGLSGYWEGGRFPTHLYGIDFTYAWRPLEGKNHSIVVGGEFFFATRSFDDGTGIRIHTEPWGYYLYVQGQILQPTYVGVRYDVVRDITNHHQETRAVGVTVTYYTSEFLRFRLGYEHRTSDNPREDEVDTIMVEVNIVFGSHPVEPYWVNR